MLFHIIIDESAVRHFIDNGLDVGELGIDLLHLLIQEVDFILH